MVFANDVISIILAFAAFLTLLLSGVGSKETEKSYHHIIFLNFIFLLICFSLVTYSLIQIGSHKQSRYLTDLLLFFLFLNGILFLFFLRNSGVENLHKTCFVLMGSLAVCTININAVSLVVKSVSITTWFTLMALLATCQKRAGAAEIAMKIVFNCVLVVLFSLLSLVIFEPEFYQKNYLSMFFSIIVVFLTMGIPPFYFGHINFADGMPSFISYYFYTTSLILGMSMINWFKGKYADTLALALGEQSALKGILFLGLLLISLRAVDQSRIKRTVCYLISTIAPVIFLLLVFCPKSSIPEHDYFLLCLIYITLSCFAAFISLGRNSILDNNLTSWEDISGLGKIDKLNTFCLLVAIVSVIGIPGTFGYVLRLTIINNNPDNLFYTCLVFLSLALNFACFMRMFVFFYAKSCDMSIRQMVSKPSLVLVSFSVILSTIGALLPLDLM